MKVEEGLLYINGRDMAEMGVFLMEKTPAEHKNYDELLKGAETKEQTAVDYSEENGEELPEKLEIRFKARDVKLRFAVVGKDRKEWFGRWREFRALMSSGWLTLRLPEIDSEFRMYLKAMGEHSQLTQLSGEGKQIASVMVTLREPKPTF